MDNLLIGDVREKLKELDDCSVQCCVTSPPYWGLRDYGTAEWEGGDENCSHIEQKCLASDKNTLNTGKKGKQYTTISMQYKSVCKKCGAKRKDSQLGLEETPEEYVENMVNVFREVKRVLKDDGTCWLNLGDTYSATRWSNTPSTTGISTTESDIVLQKKTKLPDKNLVGIPWRVAFALQQDGWYLRQDIIWNKPNPMPESVQDRCTKSHEYIFLLTKSARYYYDADAIREDCITGNGAEQGVAGGKRFGAESNAKGKVSGFGERVLRNNPKGRNKRSVWTITTKPFKDAHFAVFPIEIPTYCIRAGSRAGDIVLDPFMGSGTTALASQENGRKWIGVELNPEYVKIIKKRTQQQVLF